MLAELVNAERRPWSLGDVVAGAPALTRVDRKYVVPVADLRRVLGDLDPAWGVLTVHGRRTTTYRSTYFDSPDLLTARQHVQRRRRRWKARSRLYVEDQLCRTEVKVKDGRGQTVKAMVETGPEQYGRLTATAAAFLTETLGLQQIAVDTAALRPSMEIGYERLTLARLDQRPARLTLDWAVTCVLGEQRVWVDPDHVLVETKGDLRPCDADQLLVSAGHRPRGFSKYAAAASLLRPDIADNDVRRLRGTVLRVGPADTAPRTARA